MSPTDDRDIRAALSRDPYPSGATRLSTDAEGAVVPSLEPEPPGERTAAELEAAAQRLLHGRRTGPHYYGPGGRWQVYQCHGGSWSAGVLDPLTRHKPAVEVLSRWYHNHLSALAAATDLLRHHPELWPAEPAEPAEPEAQPDPLREAAREALELLTCASHHRAHRRGECSTCRERWPCDAEQARRVLADALEDR
jgi:hypothetical protein